VYIHECWSQTGQPDLNTHTSSIYTGYNNQYAWADVCIYVYNIVYIYIRTRGVKPNDRYTPSPLASSNLDTTLVSPPNTLHYHFSLLNRRYGVRADRAVPRSQFFLRLIRLNYVSYVVSRERAETRVYNDYRTAAQARFHIYNM